MEYRKTVPLKDGRRCRIRNGTLEDGKAMYDLFMRTHAQSDYLLTYPEENSMSVAEEAQFLNDATLSRDEIQLLCEIDGKTVGSAGIERVGKKEKVRHRAVFGISVDKDYWGLGIGRALTQACIECAKRAGYRQLELDAVADNDRAIALYKSCGFVEFGRNPRGFLSRISGWQTLTLMRLELD